MMDMTTGRAPPSHEPSHNHPCAAAHLAPVYITVQPLSPRRSDAEGVFMASTGIEHDRVDVWGNAFAVASGLATPAQSTSIYEYVCMKTSGWLGRRLWFVAGDLVGCPPRTHIHHNPPDHGGGAPKVAAPHPSSGLAYHHPYLWFPPCYRRTIVGMIWTKHSTSGVCLLTPCCCGGMGFPVKVLCPARKRDLL